jgi:uncharacterized protein
MKRLGLLLALLLCLGSGGSVLAQSFPSPQGFVSDFAQVFSASGKASLEASLNQLQKDTGAEVAVVSVVDLGGLTVEEYAVQLFQAWGIGQKDEDNGVLLLMSLTDRKVRIEVGYGLEGIITDGRSGRILDSEVLPSFRNGDYEAGLTQGAAAIEKYIRDGTPPSAVEDNPLRGLAGDYTTALTWLGIITIYLAGFMARSKSIWLGTIWGGIVGVALGLTMGSVAATVGLAVLSGAVGALLDYFLSRNYKQRAAGGRPTSWWSSGGGFSSGGGGSFGGFSGGHSGGAGASRGW